MKTDTLGRRKYKRRAVQVEVVITLRSPFPAKGGAASEGLSLVGRTRNMSEAGVAFVVSAGNIDRYLKRKDLAFDIQLKLPGSSMTLQAMPVHYKRFESSEGAASYLIGSSFLNIPSQDIAALQNFLRDLPSA